MASIAEFETEIPVLYHASTTVPEMRLSSEDIVLEDDRPRKAAFTAHGDRFDELERALAEDPTVAEYDDLAKFDDHALYVVTYSPSGETKGTYHVAVEQDIVYMTVTLEDGVHYVRAFVPDRDALATLREYCSDNDIPFRLERIYQEDPATVEAYMLTDSQHEALMRAYEEGYFDTPRRTTLEAIADGLGISRQAVASRLRRGHKRLIEATLA